MALEIDLLECPDCGGYGIRDGGECCVTCGGSNAGGGRYFVHGNAGAPKGTVIGSGEIMVERGSGRRVSLEEFMEAAR